MKKTGTTIAGIIFKKGVILASDTRATIKETAIDVNCDKIHYISPNICCCGAGTSADTENITNIVSNHLEVSRLSTSKETYVISAITILQNILFQNNGMISAALIVGGFDLSGSQLYSIHPYGSGERLPFCTMGSGSLSAISILEKYYQDKMNVDAAVHIIKQAVLAGIYNDIGSGGNIDICVLTKKGLSYNRNSYKNETKQIVGHF